MWLLSTFMWLLALILWTWSWSVSEPLSNGFEIPWWLIAGGVLVAELAVVHIHFRSQSGSFSFVELPIILGVLFTDPTAFGPAVTLGAAAAFTLRGSSLLKGLYNTGNVVFRALLIWSLVSLFGHHHSLLEPGGWFIIGGAVLFSALLDMAFLAFVISMKDQAVDGANLVLMALFGFTVAGANIVLALVTAILFVAEPYSVILMTMLGAITYSSYRTFSAERRQRERLEQLYESMRGLSATTDIVEAGQLLSQQAARMFRAGVVDLFMVDGDGPGNRASGTRVSVSGDQNEASAMTDRDHELVAELRELAAEEPQLLRPGGEYDDLRYMLDRDEIMVGTVRFGAGVGVLVVADSVNDASDFDIHDVQSLGTLLQQAALAFENGRLGSRIHELKDAETQLAHEASHDSLTGLSNRARLNKLLDEALIGEPVGLTLMYIDLDDFKQVNDTLGHHAGDAVLVEVGNRLNTILRPGDVAARLGGDEFAVLLREGSDPKAVADRVLATLADGYDVEGRVARIGASVGVASWERGISSRTLLSRADVAMYTAKRAGKGSIASYVEEMADQVDAQQRLREKLRRAVDRDEFRVQYQPVFDLSTNKVVGAEALVRWESPDGSLHPEAFMAEADRSGVIGAIDELVMARVVRDLGDLSAAGHDKVWLSANLSQWSLQDINMAKGVRLFLEQADVDANRLMLEFAENAVLHDPEVSASSLEELTEFGVRLALDNFGSGAASVRLLRRFPFDVVKLNNGKSWPHAGLGEPKDDPTLLRAMVELGHTLGLQVVAEGVEDLPLVNQLVALGCDLAQGYYLAEPMSFGDLRTVLEGGPLGDIRSPAWTSPSLLTSPNS